MIITSQDQICQTHRNRPLVMTSIGGSPIHPGHTRLIRQCKGFAQVELDKKFGPYIDRCGFPGPRDPFESILLVVVNCDDFLMRKHGFVFQNENDRTEILDAIKGVDYTYIHQSDKQTIDDTIRHFQPHFFCKGGDRASKADLPLCEIQACEDYGTEILFGVGGFDKVSSSSDLIKRAADFYYSKRYEEDRRWEDFKEGMG